MQVTVLIVDDHAAFRAAARSLLEAEGYLVVGEAADGPGALAEAGRLRPQLVLLDVQLPGIDGFAVADRLAEDPDGPDVVLVSSRDAAAYGPRLRQVAVRGFLPKSALTGAALADLLR